MWIKRRTLEDDLNFEDTLKISNQTFKCTLVGVSVGLIAGVVGGVVLGESVNNYVELLNQAPKAIQYVVDIGCAVVGGGAGVFVGGVIGQIPSVYKISRN